MRSWRSVLLLSAALLIGTASPASAGLANRKEPPPAPFSAAELVLQTGHQGVNQIALSPDGTLLATAGTEGVAKVWSLRSGREVRRFAGTFRGIYHVAFGAEGRSLFMADGDGHGQVWDITTGELLRADFPTSRGLITGHPNRPYVAEVQIGFFRVVDFSTGRSVVNVAAPELSTVSFSPDGKRVASVGQDGFARIWSLDDGSQLSSFAIPPEPQGVRWSRRGTQIAIERPGFISIHDAATGRKAHEFSFKLGRWVKDFAFSPDERTLAVAYAAYEPYDPRGAVVELFDVASGKVGLTLKGHQQRMSGVLFTADGLIVTGSEDGTTRLWDPRTGAELRRFGGLVNAYTDIAFSVDGKLLISGHEDAARVWSMESGELLQTLQGQGATHVAASPAGKYVAVSFQKDEDWRTTVGLFELGSTAPPRILDLPANERKQNRAGTLVFSPDGETLAVAYGDCQIRLWQVRTGKLLRKIRLYNSIKRLAYSPDGKVLVVALPTVSPRVVIMFDPATGRELPTLMSTKEFAGSAAVAFDPSGRTITTADGSELTLWDMASRAGLRTIKLPMYGVERLVSAPDGKSLFTAIVDYTRQTSEVTQWDATSGKAVRRFTGHSGLVRTVAVSPNGRFLATTGDDMTLRLWRLDTGKEVMCLVSVGASDYVTATPDHFYRASKGALKAVAFRLGSLLLPFEQFDLKLNRPDVLYDRLGAASRELIDSYRNAYLRRLSRLGFTETSLATELVTPDLRLMSQPPLSVTDRLLKVRVAASDTRAALVRLHVLVNDVPLYGSQGRAIEGGKNQVTEELSIELGDGVNDIQVWVTNERGVESLKESWVTNYAGPKRVPELYVATIGVGDVAGVDFDLDYAVKDARDVHDLLKSSAKGFAQVHSVTLLDRQATAANIAALREFFGRSNPDDEAILFFAGHGALDEQYNYYLALSDTDLDAPEKNGLPYDDLEAVLDGIGARKKLMLIDACHSGEAEEGSELETAVTAPGIKTRALIRKTSARKSQLGLAASFELMKGLFADLRRGSGASVIASASGAQRAIESPTWKNGLFTYVLLDGLKSRKVDLDKDRVVRVSELKRYVNDAVTRLSNGGQTPVARRESVAMDFPVF